MLIVVSCFLAAKTRGRLGYVEVDSIEWIESHGNYLAARARQRVRELEQFLRELRAESADLKSL